jgi:hypothetical protein
VSVLVTNVCFLRLFFEENAANGRQEGYPIYREKSDCGKTLSEPKARNVLYRRDISNVFLTSIYDGEI